GLGAERDGAAADIGNIDTYGVSAIGHIGVGAVDRETAKARNHSRRGRAITPVDDRAVIAQAGIGVGVREGADRPAVLRSLLRHDGGSQALAGQRSITYVGCAADR